MNLETKITIYKFTPQVFTLTRLNGAETWLMQLNERKINLFTFLINIGE
jgi:hypothetical protein